MAPTDSKSLPDREKAIEAVRLKTAGHTWQHIADTLEYSSRQAAQRAAARLLDRVEGETVEDHRNVMDARLEALYAKAWEAIEKADPARHVGLSQLLQAAVRIEDRRAKLFGIDGATKSETTVVVKSALDAEIEQLVDHLKHQPTQQETK